MNENGFLKLNRKFFQNELWKAARTFSENEAWLDLIQSARFEVSPLTESIGGKEITYGRGQYPASNRFLARRWGWGEQKVKTFLGKLKRKKMVTTDCRQGMNVITLCNYERFNGNPQKDAARNPAKPLEANDLQEQIAHIVTQVLAGGQPTTNPNSKKEEERKETSTVIDAELDIETAELFDSFRSWQASNCVYVSKMDRQITAKEFEKIMKVYTPLQLKAIIEQMDNSKGKAGQPIHKRYVSVYRTFLTWARNAYK